GGIGSIMHGDSDGHDIVRIVAERSVQEMKKSLHGGSGSSKHEESERDLRAGEDAVRGASINRADDFARAGLHHLADLRTRELQSGPESEEQAGEHGDSDTERQHGQVDLDLGLVREG